MAIDVNHYDDLEGSIGSPEALLLKLQFHRRASQRAVRVTERLQDIAPTLNIKFLEDLPYTLTGILNTKDIPATSANIGKALDIIFPNEYALNLILNPRCRKDSPSEERFVADTDPDHPDVYFHALLTSPEKELDDRTKSLIARFESQHQMKIALADGFRTHFRMPPETTDSAVLDKLERKLLAALEEQLENGFPGITEDENHIFWNDQYFLAEHLNVNKEKIQETASLMGMIVTLSRRDSGMTP